MTDYILHLINSNVALSGSDPDDSARVLSKHRILADAMNAGELYLRETNREAFVQVQHGTDGEVYNVSLS